MAEDPGSFLAIHHGGEPRGDRGLVAASESLPLGAILKGSLKGFRRVLEGF